MPPVDLDSLVSVCGGGGGDNKIACETAAAPPENPDLPPDSFCLSEDAELDWYDRNAFFDRKDSAKGRGGGGTNSANLNPNLSHALTSVSQRFPVTLKKSKASIIGLPKPQKLQAAQVCRRVCKPPNVRLFPKRPAPRDGAKQAVAEPSSPKVSCMGRVRSKRDRSLRPRRSCLEPPRQTEKPARARRPGIWTSLAAMFRPGSKSKPALEPSSPPREMAPRRSTASAMSDCSEADRPAGPPGLGGAIRFASGRRSESWGAVADAKSLRGEERKPEGAAPDRHTVRGRRGAGPLGVEEAQSRRQWANAGPATV